MGHSIATSYIKDNFLPDDHIAIAVIQKPMIRQQIRPALVIAGPNLARLESEPGRVGEWLAPVAVWVGRDAVVNNAKAKDWACGRSTYA